MSLKIWLYKGVLLCYVGKMTLIYRISKNISIWLNEYPVKIINIMEYQSSLMDTLFFIFETNFITFSLFWTTIPMKIKTRVPISLTCHQIDFDGSTLILMICFNISRFIKFSIIHPLLAIWNQNSIQSLWFIFLFCKVH